MCILSRRPCCHPLIGAEHYFQCLVIPFLCITMLFRITKHLFPLMHQTIGVVLRCALMKSIWKNSDSSARMILNMSYMFLCCCFFLICKLDGSLLKKIFCFHYFSIPEVCSLSRTDKLQ